MILNKKNEIIRSFQNQDNCFHRVYTSIQCIPFMSYSSPMIFRSTKLFLPSPFLLHIKLLAMYVHTVFIRDTSQGTFSSYLYFLLYVGIKLSLYSYLQTECSKVPVLNFVVPQILMHSFLFMLASYNLRNTNHKI